MTHLQLHKLLYYVQGWSMGLRGEPIFEDPIEAWKYGPVVKGVFPYFSSYGDAPITDWELSTAVELSKDDRFFIKLVWESYKRFSALGLCEKTHGEPPWKNARGDLKPYESSSAEITLEALREFFSQQGSERPDAAFKAMPNWSTSQDAAFVEAAQEVFAKYAKLLQRLAS